MLTVEHPLQFGFQALQALFHGDQRLVAKVALGGVDAVAVGSGQLGGDEACHGRFT